MSERGGLTPNINIPYKGASDPAVVHEDNETAYRVIDAEIAELKAKLTAKEQVFIVHQGGDTYQAFNGLGEPLVIELVGDDGYRFRQP